MYYKEQNEITSSEYAKKYNITERMARNDLRDLAEKGLLKKFSDNKLSKYIF
ncbi:MAG: HTH domain-containing protein [Paludibacter sp.]|nr:HTH domain-containing protein [Paludibacter sp.]